MIGRRERRETEQAGSSSLSAAHSDAAKGLPTAESAFPRWAHAHGCAATNQRQRQTACRSVFLLTATGSAGRGAMHLSPGHLSNEGRV